MSNNGFSRALRLSYVPRWSIVPMLRQQTVSDHSWRVAMIVDRLAADLGFPPGHRQFLVATAVVHDFDEVNTGDIPSNTKPDPNFSAMSTDALLLKVADYIEATTWLRMWGHPSVRVKEEMRAVAPRLNAAILELEGRVRGSLKAVNSLMEEVEE